MSHLEDNNQTYFEHLKNSLSYSWKSTKASFYFFIHAFIPCIFTSSGSTIIKEVHERVSMKKTTII